MPNVFDPANIPPEYAHSSRLAEEQLTKLADSDQRVLGSESSTLNLLSSGLTSQAKVLNSLVDKLSAFELRAGQELGDEIQNQFDRHVTLTRKLQKSAIQTSLKDQGLLPETANIQLICSLYTEAADAVATVPETAIKNLHAFTGEGPTTEIDLKCEQFVDTALDIAVSNKLTHVGCKNLILRKLSGYANLVLQTYLDNQAMTTTQLTLTQLLGFLEKTFRAQSTPEIALHRLQNLPEIRNRNYLQPCGVIARLAKLSCRNEPDEDTRKLLFHTRSREYLLKSLQQEDRGLIQKEDQRRRAENKEPLPFIAISEYLTKFHQLKTKPTESFEVKKVSEIEEFSEIDKNETDDQNHAFYVNNQNKTYQPNRPRFNPQRQLRNNPSTPYRGMIRRNYNSRINTSNRPNFTSNPNFQKRNFNAPQRGKFSPRRGSQRGSFNTYRNGNAPQPFNRSRYQQQSQNNRSFNNRVNNSRPNFRQSKPNSAPPNKPQNRPFVTPDMVNLEANQCLLCGSKNHRFNSPQCAYWPQQPCAKPCPNHSPKPKYAHLRETCLGDFTANVVVDNDNGENF